MKQSNLRIGKAIAALTVLLTWGWTTAFAQILEPVKWEFSVHETESENELDVVFHASVDACWHIYSQFLDATNRKGAVPYCVRVYLTTISQAGLAKLQLV